MLFPCFKDYSKEQSPFQAGGSRLLTSIIEEPAVKANETKELLKEQLLQAIKNKGGRIQGTNAEIRDKLGWQELPVNRFRRLVWHLCNENKLRHFRPKTYHPHSMDPYNSVGVHIFVVV